MMRCLILLVLWCSAALAGDYVHLPSGRVAFDRADRKYTSADALRAGWRPVVRDAMPSDALQIAMRTGRLDKRTWLIGEHGAIEAHDPGAVAAGLEDRAMAAAAEGLAERALLIAQLRAAQAIINEIGSGLDAGVIAAAREILRGKLNGMEVPR